MPSKVKKFNVDVWFRNILVGSITVAGQNEKESLDIVRLKTEFWLGEKSKKLLAMRKPKNNIKLK